MDSVPSPARRLIALSIVTILAVGCTADFGRVAQGPGVTDPPWLSPYRQSLAAPSPQQAQPHVQLYRPEPIPEPSLGFEQEPDEQPSIDGPQLTFEPETEPEDAADESAGPRLQPPDADLETDAPGASPVELDIEVPAKAQVGSGVTFQVSIRNRGESAVNSVVIECEFDDALVFPGRPEKRVRQPLETLDAGQSRDIALTLYSEQAGSHCCRFTVTIDGDEAVWKSVCVEFVETSLDVSVVGPHRRSVQTRAEFTISLENVGPTQVSKLQTEVTYDPDVLVLREATTGAVRQPGNIGWLLDDLSPGDGYQLQVEFECVSLTEDSPIRIDTRAQDIPADRFETAIRVEPVGALPLEVGDRDDPVSLDQGVVY